MTDPFVRAALMGLGHATAAVRNTGTPIDTLFDASMTDERAFLLRAAARDVYVRAGLRPRRRGKDIDVAAPETLQRCSPKLVDVLTEVVAENNAELLHVAADELREARLHFPHALLPNVLGTRDRQLRAALAPVLGERGRWLARRNPAWSWALDASATSDVATLWEEGSTEQQLEAFRVMRSTDAAAAREQLAARLPKEKAEHRAALLGALEAALSIDDEPLLERALDDRSVTVKATAAELLARLPSSAFVARMQARAEAAVRSAPQEGGSVWSKIKILGRSAPALVVDPPEELDAAGARDISTRTPPGFGTRGWALAQIAAAVPLSYWTSRFGMTPRELLDEAAKTDWSAALVDGWLQAAVRQHDRDWARALTASVGRQETSLSAEQRAELARALPPDERMRLILSAAGEDVQWPLAAMLEQLPRPWPAAFAREWLQRLRRAAARGGDTRESALLVETVAIAARAMPRELFDGAAEDWTVDEHNWYRREWERGLHTLGQIIRIRRTVAEETGA